MSTQAIAKTADLENRFVAAVQRGVDAWREAGETLVQMVNDDEECLVRLQNKYDMSMHVLKTFVAIGRGSLLPQLVAAPSCIKQLPVDDQKRIVNGKVDALVLDKNGKTDTIKIDVLRAPKELVKQVIGKDGIRSIAEQRAILVASANREVANKQADSVKPDVMPWRVDGKTVIVKMDVRLNKKDLLTMLALL